MLKNVSKFVFLVHHVGWRFEFMIFSLEIDASNLFLYSWVLYYFFFFFSFFIHSYGKSMSLKFRLLQLKLILLSL